MPLNPVKSTHEGDWLHFISRIGDEVTTLQSILDGIMPGLIGLGGTWLYYFLLKKKVNPVILIFGTMIIGVIGAYFGVLAG